MDKPYLPYSRDCDTRHAYDEGCMLLCSQNPDSLIGYFTNVGYVIDYVLYMDGLGASEELPWITPSVVCKKHSRAKLLLDDSLPKSVIDNVKEALLGSEVTFIPISSLVQSCPDTPFECTTKNLFVDVLGDVWPCPKPKVKERQLITNISKEDCIEDLKSFQPEPCVCRRGYSVPAKDPLVIKRVAVEFGGTCSAACTYCYQRHTMQESGAKRSDAYDYGALERFLDGLTISELCVAGGEVLAQRKTVEFLKRYKAKRPGVKFVLKTNGFSEQVDLLGTLFERVAISLNGFHQNTVSTIMGENVSIERIKEFCRHSVQKCEYTQIKYLLSPVTVSDFPDFIDWAIGLKPEEISVTKAMLFGDGKNGAFAGSAFKGLNRAYWDDVIARISRRSIKKIRSHDPETLKGINFRFGMGADKLLKLEDLFK